MRSAATILLFAAATALAADHAPPPVQPATNFAAVETHDDDKVSIAIEPYETKEKCAIFRVDFLGHGVMPVRIIITNNGDKPISLRDARIYFVTPAGDRIQNADPEDVERLFSVKERGSRKVPLPAPLPPITFKPKVSDPKIEQEFNLFEYGALVVDPHTTQAGFLFYDVSELEHPLPGSKMLFRKLRGADGAELFYFEIPFDKYLKSKSKQMN